MADLVSLSEEDLAEVTRIERLPGYDAFVGRFTLEEHRAEFSSQAAHYLGFRKPDGLAGFVILQHLDQPVVLLRRIAIESVGRGVGTQLLRAAMDWVFDNTPATRLDLHVPHHDIGRERVAAKNELVVGNLEEVAETRSLQDHEVRPVPPSAFYPGMQAYATSVKAF